MEGLLLDTKVHIPKRTAGQIERLRLRKVLDELLEPGRRLLVLSAPAGFGKSTLLSGWIEGNTDASFAWLTVDAEDNDPVRFWRYVIYALRRVHPSFGEQALRALMAVPLPTAAELWGQRVALTLTLNDLAALPGYQVIVLDDFHLLSCPEVHVELAYALEHWPENTRLVLATRVDPPLPLARLRAGGRLVEIRAAELRFNSEESARFLKAEVAGPLEPEQRRVIEARAEGWIAGLKMAALALRGAEETGTIIAELTSNPRFILDYLAEEVLERQEEAMKEFLIRTAILERFCGALCDALTQRSEGRDTLEEIRRRNLFLVPLDDGNHWFRYHTLFADLLRARLKRLHPELWEDLHLRASRWFEANDLPDEAFRHARAARDTQRIVELMVGYSRRLIFSGWSATVAGWLAAVPEEIVQKDIRLILSRCWTSCFTNQWQSLARDLDRVQELLDGMPAAESGREDSTAGLRAGAGATVTILRAYIAYRENDLPGALELARKAAKVTPEAPPALRGAALAILGFALKESGDLLQAQEALQDAGPLFLAEKNLTAWAISMQHQVDVLIARGLLGEADRSCQEALGILRAQEGLRLPAAGYIHAAAAESAWIRNDLEQAERCWREASSVMELTGDSELIRRCTLGRSQLAAARGRPEEAIDLPRLEERPSGRTFEGFSAELEGIARVRTLIALDDLEAALELCSTLLAGARSGGRQGRAATLLALRALACWRRSEREASLTALRQALELAAPEGALRVFLDLGAGLREPLAELGIRYRNAAVSRGGRAASVLDFLSRLQDAFGSIPTAVLGENTALSGRGSSGGGGSLPPPLTAREREVLGLLAAGHSNQQIADRLFVSLATVKKHVSTVIGKLGAANRTQAAALARRHGLL